MSACVLVRPNAQTSGLTSDPAMIAVTLDALTAPTKSMARKRSPLPRKTVENNRSSTSPS
jgi:hypothetical protein